ncbi:hypothetical protein EQO05_02895 [Methanosarcina sp. MSH10X1]|uniref:hypothetical protein n=1 Tax=Methanosarcina sp. MSH10X1 TaxID=2507075 RepID=UPI000FFB99B4|nr:hypothetical protein [Methanosarcina sp. MSH10X1]RXA21385.1 hypothetical protein EQO05_02895 [Methanosarcina sp. MSH10X1]
MEENLEKEKDHSIVIAALIFLLLAAVFGVIISRQINLGKFTLPFYLIVIGMFFFATAMESETRAGEWLATIGWTFNMLGFVLFYQRLTENLQSLIYMWPLVFPAGIGLGQICYGAVKAKKEPIERGKVLVQIGFGLFILIFVVFKLFFQ